MPFLRKNVRIRWGKPDIASCPVWCINTKTACFCFPPAVAWGIAAIVSGALWGRRGPAFCLRMRHRDETPEVLRYLTEHTEVEEVLVSGGDPFSAPFPEGAALLEQIRRIRPSLLIRLCTRAPVFAPELFSAEKTGVLRGFRPLWLIPHINHPAELGPAQRECLTSFVDAGIPVQSQTVLLRGVNDCAETLHGLFHALVCLGVKPGYLFQCDLAPGTAHFRVPLARAAALWKELRAGLSGLSLPKFAVDLPGGGGKFPLEAAVFAADIESFSADGLTVRKKSGGTYTYPG